MMHFETHEETYVLTIPSTLNFKFSESDPDILYQHIL